MSEKHSEKKISLLSDAQVDAVAGGQDVTFDFREAFRNQFGQTFQNTQRNLFGQAFRNIGNED
jgi:hypothetical protein